jgi:hypothetical protein
MPLNFLYVRSLKAFWALLDFELDAVTFIKSLEAIALDGVKVDENVLARITADKAVTLTAVEPFDGSLFHCYILTVKITLSIPSDPLPRTTNSHPNESGNPNGPFNDG